MQHPELIIVDDQDDVRFAIAALAQDAMPYANITDHRSSLEALQQIKMGGVDLVIADCDMPDKDGLRLVKAIREQNFSMPIIMVSGSNDARKLGQADGIDRFIEKRFLDPDLAHAIHTLLKCA